MRGKMKKVNWGIIGSGGIADRRTIPGLIKCNNASLMACMDLNGEVAKAVADKYGAKESYTNVKDLLKADIDAVYIGTPVFCHEQQAMESLIAGKHVLIEKPIAMNYMSAQKILNEAKNRNLLIMSGFMMRYHNLHKKMREIVYSGGIGQVVSADFQFSCWYPKIPGSWRQDKSKGGGGVIMDLGVHCIDLMMYLTQARVEDVKGFLANQTHNYEVEDSANIIVKLSDGAYGRVQVNFNVPDALPSRVELRGTKGALIAEGSMGQNEEGNLYYIYSPQSDYNSAQMYVKPQTEVFESERGDLYEKQVADFSDQILTGKINYAFAESSLEVQKIVDNIYMKTPYDNIV